MSNFLYIKGLKTVEHTVFAVSAGQKYYYDFQFRTRVPYSSGQQVKRCILEAMEMQPSVVEFNYNVNKKDAKIEQKEPHSACDPSYVDQLLGGYMKVAIGEMPVKRRSPLSISAMRPLHPLLAGIETPHENLSFDRSSNADYHKVNVYWGDKKEKTKLTDEELENWLDDNKKGLPPKSFIMDQTRVSGLFTFDIAIDLRRLFCVSLSKLEREITPEMEAKLRKLGWEEIENAFGKCLLCPEENRRQIAESLASAIISWQITSNQARTYSPQALLAIAVSNNANNITNSMRGELRSDYERNTASPVLDFEIEDVELYCTPLISAYIKDVSFTMDNLEAAKEQIIEEILSFEY